MDRIDRMRALAAFHVAGARLGNRRDFAALVTLCDTRLRAHARRLCDDAETARDIVQDAWIAISRGLGGLRDDHAFLPWALRIVTRAAARDLRLRLRARATEAEIATWPEETAPDAAPDLAAAIAALPPPQRAALALYYLDGLSVAEVAVALDIPPGTVKTRLMHARNRLRAHLKGDTDGQA